MKNDINELLEYNNLSAFRDTATGIYNKAGFIREVRNALAKAGKNDRISAVLLKTRTFSDESRIDEKGISVKLDMEEAEAMKKLNPAGNVICAKLADKQFIYATVGENPENFHELLADRLKILIDHAPYHKLMNKTDNIITSGITLDVCDTTAEEILKSLIEETNKKTEHCSKQRRVSGFPEFSSIRAEMYNFPERKWDAENECRDLHLSCGHFRAAYKNLFGISFHQDLIQSRISLAKYLLMTTALSLPAIALKCGYEDDKYFLRQFRQQTGISPNGYRKAELI
jgi:AraC-like DNA-binding protein